MTKKAIIECDGIGCGNDIELDQDESEESALWDADWTMDPDNNWLHYCPSCWKKLHNQGENTNG